MVVTPIKHAHRGVRNMRGQRPGGANADQRARQRDRQDQPVPVLAVDPERGGVLRHHDRQQDGGGLERRHGQRQHRRRHLPGAGKAAFRQAERHHGGDGERVEQGVGDDGHGVSLSFRARCCAAPRNGGNIYDQMGRPDLLKIKAVAGGLRQPCLRKSCLQLPAVPQSRPNMIFALILRRRVSAVSKDGDEARASPLRDAPDGAPQGEG